MELGEGAHVGSLDEVGVPSLSGRQVALADEVAHLLGADATERRSKTIDPPLRAMRTTPSSRGARSVSGTSRR
jgi:hypothetical protein